MRAKFTYDSFYNEFEAYTYNLKKTYDSIGLLAYFCKNPLFLQAKSMIPAPDPDSGPDPAPDSAPDSGTEIHTQIHTEIHTASSYHDLLSRM
jgi:hypothetical protein